MKVRSLHDRVIVKRIEKEIITDGGLVIPCEMEDEKSYQGIVVSVGKSKVNTEQGQRQIGIKEGDKVLFSKNQGQKVKANNEDLIVLKEEDVLGIIHSDRYDFEVEQLELLRNFILVKSIFENRIGSLFVPFFNEKAYLGKVIKLGEGSRSTHDPYSVEYYFKPWEEIGLSVNDIISYGNFYNKKSETVIKGQDYIIMTDFDIECVLEGFQNAA